VHAESTNIVELRVHNCFDPSCLHLLHGLLEVNGTASHDQRHRPSVSLCRIWSRADRYPVVNICWVPTRLMPDQGLDLPCDRPSPRDPTQASP